MCRVFVCLILLCVMIRPSIADTERIDLAGAWQVRLDNSNVEQDATLPGALRDSGIGNLVGPATRWIGQVHQNVWNQPVYAPYRNPDNFKVPFWLQPDRHYVGPAWYRRTVMIPESWRDTRIVLELERPHWRTQVFVDDQKVGEEDSLSTPHLYDLSKHLTPGKHTLRIRVDNSLQGLDVGLNSHSVSDHTQSAWHGIVGRIELRSGPAAWIDSVRVEPKLEGRAAIIHFRIATLNHEKTTGRLTISASRGDHMIGPFDLPIDTSARDGHGDFIMPVGDQAAIWDEFNPRLYTLTMKLDTSHGADQRIEHFGMRQITTERTQLMLNGHPLSLRGTLECCIFPLTGYPPTDVDSWRRIIDVCKAHGLNHIRFHSWCPPEAAFIAADQAGFYYQVECSTWPNGSTSLGTDKPIDAWLYREGERIIEAYGNHPSFIMLCAGNEPAGPGRGGEYLGPWVEHFRKLDDRRLVTGGAGWPSIPQNQYHVTPSPRIQGWGQGLDSRINAKPPETMTDYRDFVARHDAPIVSHEIGQWCVYPNFDEMKRYTGALKPKNFEVFRDQLRDAGMLDQAHDFLMASGALQVMCYKQEIESALRTPGFGGFQLLDLHDFPGQGTALIGLLDPFWNDKPYITPQRFRRFCGPVVPLARLAKRTFTRDESLDASVELYQFGQGDLKNAEMIWRLSLPNGRAFAKGKFDRRDYAVGGLRDVGRIHVDLSNTPAPVKLTLWVGVAGTDIGNDWDVWVYPTKVNTEAPVHVHVATSLDDVAQHLDAGERVVLLMDPIRVKTDVALGFSSIFWNTNWTNNQPPHTLGVFCDPDHPALAGFPTEAHSNWQWWDLIAGAATLEMDELPSDLRPLVQIVPDWNRPKRLGLAFEANVGRGRLLVCSMDLTGKLDQRPVARQMRHALLSYAGGDSFAPKHTVSFEQIESMFRPAPAQPTLVQLHAKITADSAQADYEATNAIDGDPKTMWHTTWEPTAAPMPHELIIDLSQPIAIAGLSYLPRQDGIANGIIAEYAICASQDGHLWGNPIVEGSWPNDAKQKFIRFKQPITTRFVKLVVRREANGRPFASAAEIDLILPQDAQP